jgi:hypothetical protein
MSQIDLAGALLRGPVAYYSLFAERFFAVLSAAGSVIGDGIGNEAQVLENVRKRLDA